MNEKTSLLQHADYKEWLANLKNKVKQTTAESSDYR